MSPLEDRELSALIVMLVPVSALLRFGHEFKRIPEWRLLTFGMLCLLIGEVSTVLEHIALAQLFDYVEHACYLLQSLAIALWAVRIRGSRSTGHATRPGRSTPRASSC